MSENRTVYSAVCEWFVQEGWTMGAGVGSKRATFSEVLVKSLAVVSIVAAVLAIEIPSLAGVEPARVEASVFDDWVQGHGLPADTAMTVTVDHGGGAVSLPAVSTD
ncbi:MAG: hypothetical protein ACR2NL_13090, partial [Acidimicrobiia bacterium]